VIAGFFYLWGLVVVVNLYGVGWLWLLGLVWVGWFRFVFLFGMGLSGVNYLAFSALLDALAFCSGLMRWLVLLA